jgi:hypothetical protein
MKCYIDNFVRLRSCIRNVNTGHDGGEREEGNGLSVASQNRWGDEESAGHTLRSSDLFHVETRWIRVFQSNLKTSRGMTVSGVRDIIVEVV